MEKPITDLTIPELKAIIKAKFEAKIKKAQDEMETTLSFLSHLEEFLTETTPEDINLKAAKFTRTELVGTLKVKKAVPETSQRNTAEKRIEATLKTMDGEFSSGELREKTSNDGNGKEIKRGTFSGIFADLIKEKKILVVQPGKGRQGGRYLKA